MPQRRGEVTRARIRRAFFTELAKNGLRGLTVERVIRRAGVSKGSFYHHYRNMQDLLADSYDAHTSRTTQGVVRSQGAKHPTLETVLISDVVRAIEDLPDRRFIPAVLEMLVASARQPKVRSILSANYSRKLGLAERAFRQGIDNGEFRPDLDPTAAAWLFLQTIFGSYLFHYGFAETGDIAKLVEKQLRLLFLAFRGGS